MIRRWQRSALNAEEEEKAPSQEFVCSADSGKVCDSPIMEYKEETQGHAHDGASPESLDGKNVVLFGETGAGKSSVINLIAGKKVTEFSSDARGCTLEAKPYSFSFPGVTEIRIFDTVGLEEPEMGINSFMGAIVKAHELVATLHESGGIDLLLFCFKAGRVTAALQRTYRLFFEVLCGGQVPLAIVVTNLELEPDDMEKWWVRNKEVFEGYKINSVAHACITAVPAHVTMHADRREESQKALRKMLLEVLGNTRTPYVQEKQNWFLAFVERLRLLLMTQKKGPPSLKKKEKDLTKLLETECRLTRDEAQALAKMVAKGAAAS